MFWNMPLYIYLVKNSRISLSFLLKVGKMCSRTCVGVTSGKMACAHALCTHVLEVVSHAHVRPHIARVRARTHLRNPYLDILEKTCSYFHQNSDVGITEVLEMLLDKRTKYLYFFHVNIFEYSLSFKNLSNQMQYNICFLRGAHRRFVIFSVVIKEKCREMICW